MTKRKKRYLAAAAAAVLVMGIFIFLKFREPVMADGIRIGGIPVGGLTAEEAEQVILQREQKLSQTVMTLEQGEVSVSCTLSELGWRFETNRVEEAIAIGNTGGLFRRYQERKAAKRMQYRFELTGTIDEETVVSFLKEHEELFLVLPENAKISRKDGHFLYTEHKQGKSLLIPETVRRMEREAKYVTGEPLTVTAALQPELPAVTTETAMRCRTLLGSFTTTYSAGNASRAGNLKNGAGLLNQTVVYPGEELSCQKVLGPFTEENGYLGAGAYSGGLIIESVGGGVCQISSTLYNAVLSAELTVTQRMPHSMTVSYVPLARDAAIAWDYKDFRFVNSSDVPVLIESSAEYGELTVRIWGEESRDQERNIRFESITVKEIEPGAAVITKDPSKPAGYRKVTQQAKKGYEAELYKVITVGGKEVGRELVNKSYYAATPAQITVGTGK